MIRKALGDTSNEGPMTAPRKLLDHTFFFTETLIYCHPGENQHGKRKARFPLCVMFNALQASKTAAHPGAAGSANRSALP
jgi:hypothetical protein